MVSITRHNDSRPYVNHNEGRCCAWCLTLLPPYPRDGMGSGPRRLYCDRYCLRRHIKAKQRRKAKALARGASFAEIVDPLEVFAAAGWHCQACGCATPRDLMGQNQMNSPELDHIVSLRQRGPHIRSNVQCLCRRCNIDKAMTEAQAMAQA